MADGAGTRHHDLEVLQALLSAAGVLVQQQPLVQQHGINGRHVWLPPQPPAHVQQCLRRIMRLPQRESPLQPHLHDISALREAGLARMRTHIHQSHKGCLGVHLQKVWCQNLEVLVGIRSPQLSCRCTQEQASQGVPWSQDLGVPGDFIPCFQSFQSRLQGFSVSNGDRAMQGE